MEGEETMPEVACLGVLVADLLGRPIDALPPHGRLGLVEEMTLHIGGCAANTAIDLAKLGVSAAVLGKVGADGLGDFIIRELQKENLDTRGVIQSPGVSTSASMVLVDSHGERTFLHHTGANAKYLAEDVRWDVIEESKILHVAGAFIMPAFDGQPMADTLLRAREMGKITCLDTVWDATGSWLKLLAPCLPYADYFLPSLAEAQAMTGQRNPQDAARFLRDQGVKTVGLKMGEEGCYLLSDSGELTIAAFQVEAVDGTGTGDAFVAGFLCGIVHGWDMERTARFANAVGAFCVTGLGATTGIRSLEETEAFIRERSSV
jgi:sugar/nucleoside kinase (ribokinase family)